MLQIAASQTKHKSDKMERRARKVAFSVRQRAMSDVVVGFRFQLWSRVAPRPPWPTRWNRFLDPLFVLLPGKLCLRATELWPTRQVVRPERVRVYRWTLVPFRGKVTGEEVDRQKKERVVRSFISIHLTRAQPQRRGRLHSEP